MNGMARLTVEVLPIEPDRWIAVIDAPAGPFSTEATRPADVEPEVRSAVSEVLGDKDPDLRLVDDLGHPWSPEQAAAQQARLGVGYRPGRRTRLQRLFHPRRPPEGSCPTCGHDWREHSPSEGACGECVYEISHQEADAPAVACRRLPPPPPRPSPR